jgi:NhaP-type Na+/H+ or K+/H+ antiporter
MEHEATNQELYNAGVVTELFLKEFPKTFSYVWIVSLVIGIVFGVIGSILLKSIVHIHQSAVIESFTLFLVALIAYYLGDLVEASGVVALIICAVIFANYAWYNMSN